MTKRLAGMTVVAAVTLPLAAVKVGLVTATTIATGVAAPVIAYIVAVVLIAPVVIGTVLMWVHET